MTDIVKRLHAGGWPDAPWPGYPADPERDGWHAIDVADDTVVAQWWSADTVWTWGDRTWTPEIAAAASWHYLGPCLLPAEVAARIAELEDAQDRIADLEEELSIWKSVFPDVAPERVLPDRSLLEKRLKDLEAALHRISLGSQDSGTTKESLGKEARAALAAGLHYEEKRLDIKE